MARLDVVFQGIEHSMATNASTMPMVLIVPVASPNKRKAAAMGINNDKRCAISVRTMPAVRVEAASTTNNSGNKMPSTR